MILLEIKESAFTRRGFRYVIPECTSEWKDESRISWATNQEEKGPSSNRIKKSFLQRSIWKLTDFWLKLPQSTKIYLYQR